MRHRTTLGGKRWRLGLSGLLACVVAISGYAYTATNTVTTPRIGSGATAVSGFTISNVRYTRHPANVLRIRRVDFDIAPSATRVFAKAAAASTTFIGCAMSAGNTHARCTWGLAAAPTYAAVDNLRVIAVR